MVRTRSPWLDGRLYTQLQRFSDVVALSALWLLASLPLVTALPASAAMFAVVRQWSLGNEPALWSAFWRHFRENWRAALALQAVWVMATIGFLADLQLSAGLPASVSAAIRVGVLLAAVLLASTTVYALALLVSYELPLRRLARYSVLFVVGRPGTTAKCLLLMGGLGALTYLFPLTPLLVAALAATTLYRWCARVFEQVARTGDVVAA